MALGSVERVYKVVVDGTEAVRNLKKIADSTADIDSKLDAFASNLKKVGAAITAGFTFHEVVERIKGLSEAFDQIGKDAAKIGVGAEELQRLRYAADLAGVGAETMDKAMASLSVSLQHLDIVADETTSTLKGMGVNGADSAHEALLKIADRFKELPDGIEKTAEAVAIFGKKIGPELIPLLNDGAKGLKEVEAELDKFGGVIGQDTINRAEAFNDNLANLGKASTGAAAQFTAGLLPALMGLTENLKDMVTQSDSFKEFGEGVGEVLVMIAKGVVYVSELFRVAGTDIGALVAIVTNPGDATTIFKAWRDDLKKIDTETAEAVKKIQATFDKAKAGAAEAGEEAAKRLKAQANAAKEAAEAAKKLADAEKAAADAKRAAAQAREEEKKRQEEYAKIARDTAAALEDQKQAEIGLAAARAAGAKELDPLERHNLDLRNQQVNALLAYKQAQSDAATNEQIWRDMLDKVGDAADEASVAIRNFAQERLNAGQQSDKSIDQLKHERDAFDVIGDGFQRFVNTLSQGSVTAAQAIKGMVESIIVDLLQLWAHKYILDAIGAVGGGTTGGGTGTKPTAFGNAFSAGAMIPFATGGIIGGPVRLPMALIGEAGPEAVMPLRRGPDGRLGVDARGGGALNVAIHNYTDASVSAKRDSNGDLQVIIEQTRKAVAADIKRGGSDIARAAEAAWRLSRGPGAAF